MQVKLRPRTCWRCTVAAGSWDLVELPPPTDLWRIFYIIRTGSSDGSEDHGIFVSDVSFALNFQNTEKGCDFILTLDVPLVASGSL